MRGTTSPRLHNFSICLPPRLSHGAGIIAQALQFAGSFAAILALAWFARQLGLGGDPRLRDPDEARRLAGEVLHGFEAHEVVLDRAGIGALLRDSTGRIMLLRRHGARWAGRLLDSHARVKLDRTFMTIATQDRAFGATTFDFGDDAQAWATSLRAIG